MAERVALITGGAKRVGRAIGLELAAAGFDVAFTYMSSRMEGDSLVAEIGRLGRRATAIGVDLTELPTSIDTVEQALRGFASRLDVLVHSASIYVPATLQTATLELSRKFWAIHVDAPMLLTQRFAPMLREARGHVVSMVDALAEKPWPAYLPYSASKAGLANLTLGLARSLAPEVTVNGIAPGVIAWPLNYPLAEQEKYLSRVPLARPGTPQDAAKLVKFLCTDGSYITGQIIRLDGGRSLV
jgi:pteridine reductase